jgi:hypothetical protein
MKKTGYEALLEERRPGPGALARQAQLDDAARNLKTLEELAQAEAAAAAKPAGSTPEAASPRTASAGEPVPAPSRR